jgi:predicted MFS family arabinose efflux permease
MVAFRSLAVALVGVCAFLQLYTPQALLPLFAERFGASPATASLTVSATTLAVALTAPFAGALADVFGRRRIIVGATVLLALPTALIATAGSLEEMVLWRFLQGLLLPPIFAVGVAYVGEEWPPGEVATAIGLYTAGSALGGFLGRFVTGLVAEHLGWQAAYVALAGIDLAGAAVIARYLPAESRFVAAAGLAPSLRAMARHLRDRRLLATFGAGFAILFAFVAVFSYVNFRLAAAPFGLSTAALGSLFVVYLMGVLATPWTGRAVNHHGRARVAAAAIALWCAALALTLVAWLPAIAAGLALAAACGFVCQALANGFLAAQVASGRSSAVGLYATSYYAGGTVGGLLPAPAYAALGWPGVVALVIAVLGLMAAAALPAWRTPRPRP